MIDTLVEALRGARIVTVLTGAGISADSGVPTFRDAQTGLWAHYRPEELASPEAFARDPDTVWQWYRWRRQKIAAAEPNDGHEALAALEAKLPDLRLVTQNVDGLHRRAGHREVIEFHGNINVNRCHREGRVVEVDDAVDSPPICPHYGAPVRPGVVWFGEAIPEDALERATAAAEARPPWSTRRPDWPRSPDAAAPASPRSIRTRPISAGTSTSASKRERRRRYRRCSRVGTGRVFPDRIRAPPAEGPAVPPSVSPRGG